MKWLKALQSISLSPRGKSAISFYSFTLSRFFIDSIKKVCRVRENVDFSKWDNCRWLWCGTFPMRNNGFWLAHRLHRVQQHVLSMNIRVSYLCWWLTNFSAERCRVVFSIVILLLFPLSRSLFSFKVWKTIFKNKATNDERGTTTLAILSTD